MNDSANSVDSSKVTIGFFVILILLAVTSLCILSYVPPTSRDALIHHLAIPKLYIMHGGIYEIPELSFSYYPMNLDLLYLAALYFANDILPKYIHMLFGIATAALVFFYLKARISSVYGLTGAAFFLTIPIVVKLSTTVYVDLGLTFFSTAALLLLLKWIRKQHSTHYILLSGVCCGLAMGTKYNGLIVFFLLSLFIPVLYLRSSKEESVSKALWFALLFIITSMVFAAPWFCRNFMWTGNPIYPLFDSFFNGARVADSHNGDAAQAGVSSVFAIRHLYFGEPMWKIILLPFRVFFEGVDDNPQFFDGVLNPFLVILPFGIFLNSLNKKRTIKIETVTFIAFIALYFLFAMHTNVIRIRYLTPIIPPLVILSIIGIQRITDTIFFYSKSIKFTITGLYIILAIMFFPNYKYLINQFNIVKPFDYISGNNSRDEYISKYIDEYNIIKYINNELPYNAKILCVFLGWRGYYFERDHLFDHHYNNSLLLALLSKKSTSTSQIIKKLISQNINHVLINKKLFLQWLSNEENKSNKWNDLKLNLKLLTEDENYILFELPQ